MRTDLTAPGAAVLRRRRSTAENRQELLRLLGRIAVLAALAVVLFSQVFLITQAPDNGMFPAVKDGDLLIGFRLQRRFVKNQLVLYRQGGQMRLGRVLGVAGDVIVLDDSGVPLVNGTAQSGEILYPTYPREGGTLRYPYTVPDGWRRTVTATLRCRKTGSWWPKPQAATVSLTWGRRYPSP